MKTFKTPIEKILFRSSKIGLLAGGLIRHDLTANQRAEMEGLIIKKNSVIGLTAKQQQSLGAMDKKIADGETLTPKKMEERDEFKRRLVTKKGLSPTQDSTLQKYIERDGAEPELSQGAKTYIEEVWLWHEKNFKEEISSKHTRKGLQGEEDALNLISFVDGVMYVKNEERVTKGNLTGECDANTLFKEVQKRIIDDTKCSWNPKTFMAARLSSVYEWQLRAYMYLYDADIARLRYCLVDCPPDVYADELKKFCWTNNIIDEELEEYKPLIAQFDANFLYVNSGNYTQEERVKTFPIYRDEELESILLRSIELGIEYYKTITLNQIN